METKIIYALRNKNDRTWLFNNKYYNKRPSSSYVSNSKADWEIVTYELKEVAKQNII
mgnify:CR=1 FL=1